MGRERRRYLPTQHAHRARLHAHARALARTHDAGISIADGGSLEMEATHLWGNGAGGLGLYESTRQVPTGRSRNEGMLSSVDGWIRMG